MSRPSDRQARSTRRPSGGTHGWLFLILVGTLALGAGGGAIALSAKSSLAAPTITAKPANPTANTSATFAFSGPSGATFQCKLDAAAFAACASPKSYPGPLAEGSHLFQVKAVQGSQESLSTTYSWTVDTTAPPTPVIGSKPSTLSDSTNPSFSFTDAESGVQFRCSLDGSAASACSSPKGYTGVAQGGHLFSVRAVDAAGNASGPATWSWTIDSIAPSAPVITQKPNDPTTNATNTFVWSPSEGGANYQCSVENGPWNVCVSPYTYVIDTDNNGTHQFAVRAVDAAGNASAASSYSFKYDKLQPESGVPFSISGTVGNLRIGLWETIEVTLSNPNTAAIYVKAITVTAAADSTPAGCPSAANIEIEQSDVSSTRWVMVPAQGSVNLSSQGVSDPRIRLKNLPDVNQDVCKTKTFSLTYSGTATN